MTKLRKGVKRLKQGIAVLVLMSVLSVWLGPPLMSALKHGPSDHDLIAKAYDSRTSTIMVETEARVVLLLPDIDDLGKFQEFKIELENGHVLRVLHDLEQADRVPVAVSKRIRLRGEYDWSVDGGVIHWTHDDPAGQREGGWIEYQERTYF